MSSSAVIGKASRALNTADRVGPLWANVSFMCLWGAYGVSAFGDHLSELGLWKLMAAPLSDRQVQLQAAMTFVFFLPFLLLAPLAGVLADRASRKRIMIAADLVRAAIVASILWGFRLLTGPSVGLSPVAAALLPLLLVGTFAALFSPARIALLPNLVADEQLTRANSLSNGLGIIATMLSYSVGGYLAAWHVGWNFRIDAATFLVSAGLLTLVRPTGRSRYEGARVGYLRSLAGGLSYLRDHRRVRELILLATLFWTVAAAFNCTIPPIVSHRYGLGIEALGLFRGSMGAGMVVGAALLSYFGEALRADVVIAGSLFGAAAMLAGFALADGPGWGAFFAIGAGVCGVALLIVIATLLQRLVPDYVRGRIFGIADLATVAGLLLATGALGLVPIRRMDAAVVEILFGLAATLGLAGLATTCQRLRRSRFGAALTFWRDLNEFYCKWFFRLRREGICTIPTRGPAIVAANHTCSIDPLLLLAASPHRYMGFMIARQFYHLPAVGRLMRMIGCIPTSRSGIDTVATRQALRALQTGKVVAVFPEGGIPAPGEVREPRAGVALLALRSGAAVIPAYISGTRYSRSLVWPFFRRHRARVRFGRPVDLSCCGHCRERRELRRRLARLIMQQIRQLGIEAAGCGASPAGDPTGCQPRPCGQGADMPG